MPDPHPASQQLLAEYAQRQPQFLAMKDAALAQITALLDGAGLKIHGVTGRVKAAQSLAEKLERKPGRYASLDDVKDLLAVRVVTYFESDVHRVADLLTRALSVDWANSVDKSMALEADRFGYLGVHYVLAGTAGLPGALSQFPGVPFEVQIRSILQHAWAEIEHDLGYKSREVVPLEIRRRLSRLAGLLEVADEEFMAVGQLTLDYVSQLPGRIAQNPDSVYIDAQSVPVVLAHAEVTELDRELAQVQRLPLVVAPDPERTQKLTSALHYVGVNSVGQLLRDLRRLRPELLALAGALTPRLRVAWGGHLTVWQGSILAHYALYRALTTPGLDAERLAARLNYREGGRNHRLLAQLGRQALQELESGPTPEFPR